MARDGGMKFKLRSSDKVLTTAFSKAISHLHRDLD